jgi:chitodextrinase
MTHRIRIFPRAIAITLLAVVTYWSALLPAQPARAQGAGFVVGARVQATADVNVRSAPWGTRLGVQRKGALGTIVEGPATRGGEVWWRVNYHTGVDGWSVQRLLRLVGPITPMPGVDATPPTAPTGVSAVAVSSSQIDLSWGVSSDNVGVAGYQVFRDGTQIAMPTANAYSDTGLAPSTSYTYTVQAYDAAGNSSASSAPVVATTQPSSVLIPAERLPLPGTWERAGVEGGIPERMTICADVTKAPYHASNTGDVSAVSAIQRAIDSCPGDQVVFVPPGAYKIDSRIEISKPVVLRGAGSSTVFQVSAGTAILMQSRRMPWPPPKNNPAYFTDVTGGAMRGSTSVTVANAASVAAGNMIMVDEEDDPALVWAKNGGSFRSRASMHMVGSTNGNTITFRPPLPISYTRSPRLSWFPDAVQNAGIEDIKFIGDGSKPVEFIKIFSAWNVWVKGSEFANMPSKTVVVGWSGHVELRKNHLRDQTNGGPNSEGLDFLADVNWSLIVDNICVAAGYPQINIGDGGAGANFSGGFGNVIAYNYCVDSFYTDPPTSPNHGKMTADIGTNHSPHAQYTLVEGNVMSKFGSDAYHGSGSHSMLLRNVITGRNRWEHATNRIAVQIDRKNTYYSIIGNVLGETGAPASMEYADTSGWRGSAIYRLGFPDMGNDRFSGTYPPLAIPNAGGGPRDLYVDRNNTKYGTTLIEGNWNSVSGKQDWTIDPTRIPSSLFLTSKPDWFGDLAWPPVDPSKPVTDDPTIIPAGYRFKHGIDPPGVPPARAP